MPFTRTQAAALLNKAEMGLYDDSRANGLKALDATGLARRVERARTARDRARDLLRRQKLAARGRTGSKSGASGDAAQRTARKAELLAELLARFQEARRAAPKPARKAASSRTAARKATARQAPAKQGAGKGAAKKVAGQQPAAKKAAVKKTAAKKAAVKKAAVKKAAVKKAAVKKTPAGKTVAGKSVQKKPVVAKAAKTAAAKKPAAKKSTRRAAKAITPRQALANTRKLLEAKQQHDREPQHWQALDPEVQHVPQPGYQSGQAADKAQALHAGESRMASIHGSMGARDRRNQGKRDHRGDTD